MITLARRVKAGAQRRSKALARYLLRLAQKLQGVEPVMEKRAFGKTGMQVSVLGFGGAEIGFEGADLKTVETVLMSALDCGLNIIDTAECYETSEELIGQAVSKRRDQFYLFTKCGHGKNYADDAWDAASIEKSIDRSLKRLQVDHVDLVQLHSCSLDVLKQGEAIEALKKARDAGKTRFIGYSGDSQAALYAIETGEFDALQTSVNIADQECIELTLPLAAEKQMGVIAKRPIANAAWRYSSVPENDYHKPYWERLQKLQFDFINGDADQSAETALRFTLSLPQVHTMIVGTKRPGRWEENARLVSKGSLPKQDFDRIRDKWKQNAGADWVGLN